MKIFILDKFSNLPLRQSPLTFVTYTKEEIKPLGYIDVEVRYGSQSFILPLYVFKTNSPSLFGRERLQVIQLNWKQIHKMSTPIKINQVLQRLDNLFNGQVGKVNGIETKLNLKAEAKPVFPKARPVPYTKKSKISERLNLLESQGIIQKLQYSEWAAPILLLLTSLMEE